MKNLIIILTLFLLNSIAFSKVYTFGVIGDAGNLTKNHFSVKKSLQSSKIKYLIMPGDNLYDMQSSYEAVWDGWREDGFKFPVVALGNHYTGVDEELRYFNLKSAYYIKSYGDELHFIVMDSERKDHVDDQVNWLRNIFESKKLKGMVFVVFHHPPVWVSPRHNWTERRDFQEKVFPLIKKYRNKIEGLIVGHDHIASFIEVDSIPIIISGAVMETLVAPYLSYVESERNYVVQTRWVYNSKDPYWVRMDIDTSKKNTWINFVNANKNTVDCSIYLSKAGILSRENCLHSMRLNDNF